MYSRVIRSQGGSQALKDCLASLLALEAIRPSREIYIISPWISNAEIITDHHSKFANLFPFITSKKITLADILLTFAWRGSTVRLICNPSQKSTSEFLGLLGGKVEHKVLSDNHEKGMVTDNFYLHGSMNFTYSGIYINGECVRITTEQPDISSALISVRARWEESVGL
ncbi:aspartokinases [Desulfocucumis palustris]|uniref:Aspartokinases n=1 Tax=Desulfocucumis palustris TaxID=1898651 RepID=A0A2L2X8D0_9FIRM|nr:phospholipase D-like domain-containing protein DpdK [Desulfocucumis palustris]GBF31833.1 aspartokinases [Desulfocucumis palustris]